MAVKIIKPGRTKKHDPIYFKCENCGCIFTADDKDDYEIEFTLRNEFDLISAVWNLLKWVVDD